MQIQIMERDRFQNAADLALLIRRQQVRKVQPAWFARFRHAQDSDHVQSQERQVREIVLAERLVMKMRSDEPQAAQ
ncbi:MAG: hypothetical protein NTNFB01_34210 [Nitrospira sp.]